MISFSAAASLASSSWPRRPRSRPSRCRTAPRTGTRTGRRRSARPRARPAPRAARRRTPERYCDSSSTLLASATLSRWPRLAIVSLCWSISLLEVERPIEAASCWLRPRSAPSARGPARPPGPWRVASPPSRPSSSELRSSSSIRRSRASSSRCASMVFSLASASWASSALARSRVVPSSASSRRRSSSVVARLVRELGDPASSSVRTCCRVSMSRRSWTSWPSCSSICSLSACDGLARRGQLALELRLAGLALALLQRASPRACAAGAPDHGQRSPARTSWPRAASLSPRSAESSSRSRKACCRSALIRASVRRSSAAASCSSSSWEVRSRTCPPAAAPPRCGPAAAGPGRTGPARTRPAGR